MQAVDYRKAEDGLVGILDEDELGVVGGTAETHIGNGADDTPTVVERQVHLVSKVARLPADNAQNDVLVINTGCQTRDETLHNISLGEDALYCPSSELATVVLHLSSNDGTTLGDKLAPPVKSTTAALSLAVELVESVDADVLVLAADGVPLDGVDLWVTVGHGDLGGLVLNNNLVGEVVVDVGGLLGEGVRLVDGVLATIGSIERGVGGVLVDCHHIKGGIITLIQEDLVALSRDDNIPGVNGSRRAHEHGENAIGGEDVVDILSLVGVEVQLSQTVEVDLLEQLPLSLDVDTGITVTSRLVIILPAEATTATASVVSTTTVVAPSATSTGTAPCELGSSASGTGLTTALAAATGEDGAATIS
ncbi:hypothetical protein HG530_012846 [Fusarium avenaceum]|nr:hypothetical protein HG530_012846 [Fusarium avenaceum]